MPILGFKTQFPGTPPLFGIPATPKIVNIYTTDTVAEVTATGYLNGLVATGTFSISDMDVAIVSGNDNGLFVKFFKVEVTGEPDNMNYSLVVISSYS
jgi:hypothetical protein